MYETLSPIRSELQTPTYKMQLIENPQQQENKLRRCKSQNRVL